MQSALGKTSRNLIILAVISAIVIVVFSIVLSIQFERSSIDLRKAELKRLVSLGLNSISDIRTEYAEGRIGREEALKMITDQVRKLVFEDRIQPNYLFMSSYDGTMLVQPYQPDLEGSDQWDLTDTKGKYIIRELVEQAKTGSGYVTYSYYPPGTDRIYPKISYVTGLPEFGCYIGTGIYISDIKALIRKYFIQTMIILLSALAGLIIAASFLIAPIITAVQHIASKMTVMQETPLLQKLELNETRFRQGSDARFIVSSFGDLTERLANMNRELIDIYKEREKMKEILMKEMNHRIKNNLQIIISLLNLQRAKADSPELIESFDESINRMQSISMLHRMLYQENNSAEVSAKKYIDELVDYMIHSFGIEDDCELSLEIGDFGLNVETAVNIGLLINEMITNSVKHARSEENGIRIEISLKEENGKRSMKYRDSGPGIPEEHQGGNSAGLGMQLIFNLAKQLGGELKTVDSNGTLFILTF